MLCVRGLFFTFLISYFFISNANPPLPVHDVNLHLSRLNQQNMHYTLTDSTINSEVKLYMTRTISSKGMKYFIRRRYI